VEVNGQLARACRISVSEGIEIVTGSPTAESARREAFDRILGNHLIYSTVCDNNNQQLQLYRLQHNEVARGWAPKNTLST
jgi:formate dehydrogenase major subunit